MGNNRKVVLVHGWGGSYETTFRTCGWEQALLEAGLVPIGVDLPGHGPYGGSEDPNDYADMATALGQHIPEDTRLAVSFSLGTKLLLELEVRTPNRFDRIALGGIGDNLFAPEAGAAAISDVLLGRTPLDAAPPGIQALVLYAEKSGSHPKALAAILERSPNPVHRPERLSMLQASILLVNALADRIAIPDETLVAALPSVQVHHLPVGGHVDLPPNRAFIAAAVAFLTNK